MTPAIQRQYLGCGFLPKDDRVRLTMWQPPSGKAGYNGPTPTVCAGYTTSLPEVREAAYMHRHWNKGSLAAALCDDKANGEIMSLIVILDSEINAVDVWRATPAAEGGGGA